jgi:serine/threonine protein kinase
MKKGVAKIADFGFAKKACQNFKDLRIGTPICMAPEGLIENMYGAKTDVWAFGVVLY